jgi:hypothetical protein
LPFSFFLRSFSNLREGKQRQAPSEREAPRARKEKMAESKETLAVRAAAALLGAAASFERAAREARAAGLAAEAAFGEETQGSLPLHLGAKALEAQAREAREAAKAFEAQARAWEGEGLALELAKLCSPSSGAWQKAADLEAFFAEQAYEAEGEARAALGL